MTGIDRRTISLEPRHGFSVYHLMTSLVVPRPIAWVSTISPSGQTNLAPFSYFQAISSEPPILMLSIGTTKSRRAERKDTLANIEQTGVFVINLVPEQLAEVMNRSALELPAGVSEIEMIGLTTFPSQRIAAPCIVESPVNIECRLERTIPIGDATVVFGEMLVVHAREELLNERGLVDAEKLRPLARLGESWYEPYRERIRIERAR